MAKVRPVRPRWVPRSPWRMAIYLVLVGFAFITLFPLIWMIVTSLKPDTEIVQQPHILFPASPTLEHYQNVWPRANLGRLFINSTVFATTATAGALVFDSLAAYALARFEFAGRMFAFVLVVFAIMVPFQVILIPLYKLLSGLHLINTYQGLIIPRLTTAFGIFFLRQFFLSIPRDLQDAARVDGASALGVYRHVIVPNAVPAFLTLGLLHFMGNWNDLLWPLVVAPNAKMQTLPAGLASFVGQHVVEYGLLMAAATLAMAPVIVLFLLVQRRFIEGIATTGMR